MSPLRVWAPDAETVEVEIEVESTDSGSDRVAMARGSLGWWTADREFVGRYRFVVDGTSLPDPMANRLPDGPDGWSQTVDHSAFVWTDSTWTGFPLAAAVLYELHIGTFSSEGTFDGAIGHLDRLVELGVNAVELMPVASFPGVRGWGYDGVGLWAPHEPYGGPDGMKRLVDACHARGLAVVLDVVYNHLGPSGNHLGEFGPYFTDHHHTPWGSAINLDGAGSDEVRSFIVGNALHWMEDHHVDGLRLDAVHELHDESATHILEEIGQAVRAAERRLQRTLWVIAESDLNDPGLVRSVDAHGFGLDAAWSDDFHHGLHVALTGERSGYYDDYAGLANVALALNQVFVYDGSWSAGRRRRHGRPVGNTDRNRFVGFAQNHDQIGNRATGDRLGHLVSRQRLEIAAALVLTAPFVPMLFQGEEWGSSAPFLYFTDHQDPDLAEAVRNGRRSEFAAFGWLPEDVPDPQSPDSLERSRLVWEERDDPEHAALLQWYSSLISLRRSIADLSDGRSDATTAEADDDSGILVVRRNEHSVVVNLGVEQWVSVCSPVTRVLLANIEDLRTEGSQLYLPHDGVAVVEHRWTDPAV